MEGAVAAGAVVRGVEAATVVVGGAGRAFVVGGVVVVTAAGARTTGMSRRVFHEVALAGTALPTMHDPTSATSTSRRTNAGANRATGAGARPEQTTASSAAPLLSASQALTPVATIQARAITSGNPPRE